MDPKLLVKEGSVPPSEKPQLTLECLQPITITLKTKRAYKRLGERLLTEAANHCGRLCNEWFLFYQKHLDNVEVHRIELEWLDALWKKYLRSMSKTFKYDECENFFLQRMKFLIGDKAKNEERIEKMKTFPKAE